MEWSEVDPTLTAIFGMICFAGGLVLAVLLRSARVIVRRRRAAAQLRAQDQLLKVSDVGLTMRTEAESARRLHLRKALSEDLLEQRQG